jgi:acetyl esterase/lipase
MPTLFKTFMKKLSILFLLSVLSTSFFGQCDGRYQTEIFNSVSVSTVNYSDVYTDQYHEMDIYTPDGDTATNRPVIIYMHGGAFYSGDKNLADCVDFCTSYAKMGYVAISANYRLSANPIIFALSTEEQYTSVLKAVADIKAAVRYVRKDHSNGNSLGVHPQGIFVGGYSAGAVLSIHLAYLDQISDLPTSPTDVQALVASIGGTLEGNSGNSGYSSDVRGIVSFAGGINDLAWIDPNDEPIVFVHGTTDLVVNYNCGPGTNQPTVLTLCGMNAMKPVVDSQGVLNDTLIYTGEGHGWPASGHANPLFTQAVEFSSNFLYPLLPCNSPTLYMDDLELDLVKQFPNPAREIVHYSSNKLVKEIIVHNQMGQVVENILINETDFDLTVSSYNEGVYYVELIFNDNNTMLEKLIVIN